MRLSLAWGMPVARVIDSLSLDEFRQWVAYSVVEPFGPLQDEIRAATIATTVANSMGAKVSPADLFPSLRGERRSRSNAEIVAGFKMAAKMLEKGKSKRDRKRKDNQ